MIPIEENEWTTGKIGGWAKQKVNLGTKHGVTTEMHFEDNKIITVKKWDAERFIREAAEARALNAMRSRRPNEMFVKVGVIPRAELGKMLVEGSLEDDDYTRKWFKERPKLVWDEKYIK